MAALLGLVYWKTEVRQDTVLSVNGLLFQTISYMNYL